MTTPTQSPAPTPSATPSPTPTPSPSPTPVLSFDCAYNNEITSVSSSATTRIEVEHYDTCAASSFDSSTGNAGAVLRSDNVDIAEDSTQSNGYILSETVDGEYLEFTIQTDFSGMYQLSYRTLASTDISSAAAQIQLSIDEIPVANSAVQIEANASADWTSSEGQRIYLSDGPQVLRLSIMSGGADLDYFELIYDEALTLTPNEIVAGMDVGINLGNTLDAFPNEGDWAPVAELEDLQAFKNAGFNHVRIPATWDDHTSDSEPYAVSETRMDRTEEVVDWALAQGFYVILNAHHEHWLKENYSSANQDRFAAIWTQISERFSKKSARLMLEILNEPNGLTIQQADEVNARILPIIRANNPTRSVVFSGNGYTPIASLLSAAIPDDDYLIGNFHSYDPWPFAGQCLRTWGTAQDHVDLENIYQSALSWSTENNIPVMVNEFGAAKYDFTAPENICDPEDRLAYLAAHAANANATGIAATLWDDAGSFAIYDRATNTWEPALDLVVEFNQ